MPFWDLFFKIGGDTKPLKQALEAAGAHVEAAGAKIGKRFGLTWKDAMAGVVIGGVATISAALADAMKQTLENVKGAAQFHLPVEDFELLKNLSDETGVSIETLVKGLQAGGDNAKRLREEMEKTNKGFLRPGSEAAGWIKHGANESANLWQTGVNLGATYLAWQIQKLTYAKAALWGGAKAVGTWWRTGGDFDKASGVWADEIAKARTAGSTAMANARIATGTAQLVKAAVERKPDKRTFAKYETGVEVDSLAKVGILYSRFGMQSRHDKWEDEMLASTKVIADNTAKQSGPPPLKP